MKKTLYINALELGAEVKDIFVVSFALLGQSRNGPYWRLELKDATGSIEAKIWSPLSQAFSEIKVGTFALVEGKVTAYRERNELVLAAFSVLNLEEEQALNIADFLEGSSQNIEELYQELLALCDTHFTYSPWKKFAKLLFKHEEIQSQIKIAVAAKTMHHAYAGGLLEHILGVSKLCLSFANLYPYLDKQMLLAGAICHDLGKLWELDSGIVVEYTDTGKLIGHISIILEKLEPIFKKSGLEEHLLEHLKHLILSHHGTREFGSPCLPSTAEAMALHYADNLDAKLNQIQKSLSGVQEGASGWSPYVASLERSLFKANPSPDGNKKNKNSREEQESQCSLLLKG